MLHILDISRAPAVHKPVGYTSITVFAAENLLAVLYVALLGKLNNHLDA